MYDKIIVHVGMPKTGTTAMQYVFLNKRTELLEKYSLLYPGYAGSTCIENAQHFPITRVGGICNDLREHYLSKKPVVDLFDELILYQDKCKSGINQTFP
jgi:hypothetical protein